MPWSKPNFEEITLNMEVTAYVNTDDKAVISGQWLVAREEGATATFLTTDYWPLTTDH